MVSAIAPDVTINELIDPAVLPSEIRDRYLRIDHRGSYLQMHFALAQPPAFAAPYQALNDPSMQASMGIFCTPEQVQQQWEDCRRGIVPADPTVVLQIPSLHDPAWPRRVSRPRRRSQCGSRSRVAQNTEGTAGQRSKWGRT